MLLLSILRGHTWLVWGCTERGRRCSRWLLTGLSMEHLEKTVSAFTCMSGHCVLYLTGIFMTNKQEYRLGGELTSDLCPKNHDERKAGVWRTLSKQRGFVLVTATLNHYIYSQRRVKLHTFSWSVPTKRVDDVGDC